MGLMVIDSGFWTTVQDAGRVGYREWGVPTGGAFDRGAADLANALVGNGSECSVLELTLRGGIFEALGSVGIALAGAPIEASVVATDDTPRQLRMPSSCVLHAGERLVLGRTLEGARTYLAIRGGFQTPLRMGSRSSEQPLRRGDFLQASAAVLPTRHPSEPTWRNPAAQPFRIIEGPEHRGMIASEFWMQGFFRVGSRSNRMGLRLDGPSLELTSQPDRLSAPVAPGAIQVAGGQLIILGVACGTMGGYPHVAHVVSADLDRVGQLSPGDQIQFRPVAITSARELDVAARLAHRALLVRVASMARDV
jgi:5-oxoprolinase (ATP-hydrolysing) subunit C